MCIKRAKKPLRPRVLSLLTLKFKSQRMQKAYEAS